jgi:molybdopterin-containing oxidoreductase family iron-sulfur binding subunit
MTTEKHNPHDLDAVRRRLGTMRGKNYWRCLEELADSAGFAEVVRREYPAWSPDWSDPITRRRFLTLMGASLALAGAAGCSMSPAPQAKIVPFVRQPEDITPGKPLFYATAMALDGVLTGVLVESHEGRPTKIEGNHLHPASLGATDVFTQASILDLYDPDRSQAVTYLGRVRDVEESISVLGQEMARRGTKMRLRVLSELVNSPTLANQMRRLLEKYPGARWYQYEPVGRENARAGAQLAYGRPLNTYYRLHEQVGGRLIKAEVILSLDADFLSCGPGHLRYVRQFSQGRQARAGVMEMNRLYVVEGTPSNTGAAADHRLALRPSEIENFARAVAAEVANQLRGQAGADVRGLEGLAAPAAPSGHARWIAAVVRDLAAHRGGSLVLAGDQQPPVVHALAHAINLALDNVGRTVVYTEPLTPQLDGQLDRRVAAGTDGLRELTDDLRGGRVDTLLILGGNPVYNAPADLGFGEALEKLPLSVLRLHLASHQDETSAFCQWHLPESHYLEAWGDGRAFDGTVSIQQPLIAPLYASRSATELLEALLGAPTSSGYEIVRAYWQGQHKGGDFEQIWRKALHDGVWAGTAAEPLRTPPAWRLDWASHPPAAQTGGSIEIIFRPDPTLYDGRYANNGWQQELPKPLTRLTWDNAAIMSPATARKLRLPIVNEPGRHGGEHGEAIVDVVRLNYGGREVNAPVWVMPGHPDDAVTLHLGYGRSRAGRVGTNTGVNAYALRTSQAPWFGGGLGVAPLPGESYSLASVQQHHLMEGREIVQAASLKEFLHDPHFANRHEHEGARPTHARQPLTLYHPEEHPYLGYKWGMAIDLTACVGCGACVVACQAENNIPVVGKEQVLRGREMHWLRIDTYYEGNGDDRVPVNPRVYFQPVPCMHCENAPCELVCPVAATVHSDDGLNDMVYNRCVGTRYCSNNCPYKVRRFNFLQFSDYATESLKLLNNPDVTVRSRGVMEKCTYCVQRIREAEIDAKREDRRDPTRPGVAPIHDGEVLTACQAACPANAIVFGDMNDPKSQVTALKAQPHDYALLSELNIRPRTTYLAAVRNPNPELEPA